MSDEKKTPEPEPEEQGSAVARLLREIKEQYEAAQRGLTGLSYGSSKHDFLNAKADKIGQAQEELEKLVGPEKAGELVVKELIKQGEEPKKKEEKE